MMNEHGKSDRRVVSTKPPNKGKGESARPKPAEAVAGRRLAKSNPHQRTMFRTQRRVETTPPLAISAEEEAWGDVGAAFRLIPQEEQPSWLDRAQEKLRDQGLSWLETCKPVVRSLAVELWGLGMPVDLEACERACGSG